MKSSKLVVTLLLVGMFIITNNAAAARLDGCNPSAPENQNVKGSVWKSKCLNGNKTNLDSHSLKRFSFCSVLVFSSG